MDNSVPCGPLPPLIPANSSVTPSLIDKFSLHPGRICRRRRASITSENPSGIAIGCPGNESVSGIADDDDYGDDGGGPQVEHYEVDPCPQLRHCNTPTFSLKVSKEDVGDAGGRNPLSSVTENNLLGPLTGSGGETTPPGAQSMSNSCTNSSPSSGTNGASSTELSPLTGSGTEDDHEGLSGVVFGCGPQGRLANLTTASPKTNNAGCANSNDARKTLVNNLEAAGLKGHYCRESYHPDNCLEQHPYIQDYRPPPAKVNIPVESCYSILDDSNRNSLLSVPSGGNVLSPKRPGCQRLSANAVGCPALSESPATDSLPSLAPTTTMPYSNCVPFKQGPLVHGNGSLNGNMVPPPPKCCTACTPNGLVISLDVNKMSPAATRQNQNVTNDNQEKHACAAELVNYKNGNDGSAKTVLLFQSNLNSSQSTPQQHYHACKGLKWENVSGASYQPNKPTPISSSSQVPVGASVTPACVNCNPNIKTGNKATNSSLPSTNGKLGSKKGKVLHNLHGKFQRKRFISSFQDCCRSCNTYGACRESNESLDLEAGLLCPTYSFCDSGNVASAHNGKEDYNYKNQLASLVREDPSVSLTPSKSNNNCLESPRSPRPYPHQSNNDFSSSAGASQIRGPFAPGGDIREDDSGDFIEADFPPVATSGRLMSSSTDSTESSSSLAGSDIHDANSPLTSVPAPANPIAGVSSLCSNQTTSPLSAPAVQGAPSTNTRTATLPTASVSPRVTGANANPLKAAPRKAAAPSSYFPLPGESGYNVKQEQTSSVIRSFGATKNSSLGPNAPMGTLSLAPGSSPSSCSSSSSSSPSSPACSFLCSGDRHSNAAHKTSSSTSRSASTGTTKSSSHSCHNSNSVPLYPLPLAGISARPSAGGGSPITTSHQPLSAATLPLSPEVDFLDLDIVTPSMDSEQYINSASSSNGTTTGFDFSLYEIPYADEVDSACPSPVDDLSPNMVMGAAGGGGGTLTTGGSCPLSSSTPHAAFANNCATNDLSASSSNSNLSSVGRGAADDPPRQSNLEAARPRVPNAFSNLYSDYRDDDEENGSHDGNEGDHQHHPRHHHHHRHLHHHRRHHHCGSNHSVANGSLNNNLLVTSDSIASNQDIDLREHPGVSEPIYEDIDGVHLDKCTADSPGDKCCCVSPDSILKTNDVQVLNIQHSKKSRSVVRRHSSVERVMIWDENQVSRMQVKQTESDISACGPIAVLNVLNAFDFPVEKSKVLEKAPVNLRETSAPIAPYLFSRAKAGTTAEVLIKCVESVTNGLIRGKFFDFHPQRDVHLLKWLAEWMKKDAVPLATLNLQKSVRPGWTIPDSWHHQMIYGVSANGVHLTNPLKLESEESLMLQLTSESVLLIRRYDIISRFTDDTNLSQLMTHKDSNRWRTMNVLGQVVNVLREASMPRFPGYRPQVTQHIQIPAAYRAGITLFMRQDSPAFQELMTTPDLPLKETDLPRAIRALCLDEEDDDDGPARLSDTVEEYGHWPYSLSCRYANNVYENSPPSPSYVQDAFDFPLL